MTPAQYILENAPLFIKIRRELHQIPELGTQEHQTGAKIMEYLKQWDIPFLYPVAKTGIVAKIVGSQPGSGPVVALRADMDALPLTENSSLSYHSLHEGRMHACGHDAHMAIALGCAAYFKKIQQQFCGCIKIFFQPAEETIGGAKRMIADGCMNQPNVDYVIGLHVAPGIETGAIELKEGPFYAASDEIHLTLKGQNTHGAYPELGIDAIVMAGALISALQSLVSRSTSPLDQAVLTLGTIHGGTAHNIVADEVIITGALRTTNPATRALLKEAIVRQTAHIAAAFKGTGKADIIPGYNALSNPAAMTDILVETAAGIVGSSQIHYKPSPGMGVEDFSFFQEKAPGVFYHLGCGNKQKEITAPLHSKEFAIDEDCLALGIQLQASLALALLQKKLR